MSVDEKQKRERFLREVEAQEMSYEDDPLTTWGNHTTDRMVSPLVLRRYFSFLRKLNIILFSLLILLIFVMLGLVVKFLFFHSYEQIIFSDGTDMTCLFDPKSGVMKQNDH